MRALVGVVVALAGCTPTLATVKPEPVAVAPAPVVLPTDPIHAALQRFVDAVQRQDFVAARDLLSSPWRAQYSAERLQQDFAADPLVGERMARLKAAAALPVAVKEPHAHVQLDAGRAVRFVWEEGGWKIAALE